MCSTFRVYRSFIAPLLSTSCISYPPDEIFYCRKKIKVLHTVLKTNRFHFYILIHTCASALCILCKDTTVLGTLHFFNIFPAPVNITSFLSPLSFSDKLALVSLSSILPTPINISSTINSTLQDLLHLTIGHWTRNDFLAIPTRRRQVSDVSKPAIGKTHLSYVIIIGDPSFISVRPYYLTVEQLNKLQHEVDKFSMGIVISPSASPWSSLVILEKKPDGTYRFLVDF